MIDVETIRPLAIYQKAVEESIEVSEKDMADIPDNVKDNLELIFVDNVDEVLKIALTKPLLPIEWDESETPSKKGDLTEDDADMDSDNPITH